MAGEEERNGKKMKAHKHRRSRNTRDSRMKNDNENSNISITSNTSITSSVHNCHAVDRPLLSPSTKVVVIVIIVSLLDDLVWENGAYKGPGGNKIRNRVGEKPKGRIRTDVVGRNKVTSLPTNQ